MTKYLLSLGLLFYALPILATPQFSETLVYQGKHYNLYALPLYDLYETDTIKYLHLVEPAPFCNTACYRKYVGTWEIIGEELYLTHLSTCCGDLKDTTDLKILFGNKCVEGMVKADWFSDVLTTSPPDAQSIYYIHGGWGHTYNKEIDFHFEKGKLIKIENHTNTIKRSQFKDDIKIQLKFLRENVQWKALPKIETTVKVYVRFSVNAEGKIDSMSVKKGYSEPFDEEAMRLVSLFPDWEVLILRGKVQRKWWHYTIIFRKEE